MCGYTLGDYIRMRRLSLAADELRSSNDKIIDIALRYGYETPESFTRAFSRFHGVTPTEARNGGTFKSFSKLSVKLILTGGKEMDYRIEKPGAIKVICKRESVHKPETGAGTPDITGFWTKCGQDGTIQKICSISLKSRGLVDFSEFASRLRQKEICSLMESEQSIMVHH